MFFVPLRRLVRGPLGEVMETTVDPYSRKKLESIAVGGSP